MGKPVILSSRFFLLFTGRKDAHMSTWHFYFSPFKHPPACSHQAGEEGPGPSALCSYGKMTRRSQLSGPPAQNFRQEPEAQVGLEGPAERFPAEIPRGAL